MVQAELAAPERRHNSKETQTARKKVVGKFRNFDKNGDGMIDRAELGAVLQRLDHRWSEQRINRLFRVLDSDGNGAVDYEEFIEWAFGNGGVTSQDLVAFRDNVRRPAAPKAVFKVRPKPTPKFMVGGGLAVVGHDQGYPALGISTSGQPTPRVPSKQKSPKPGARVSPLGCRSSGSPTVSARPSKEAPSAFVSPPEGNGALARLTDRELEDLFRAAEAEGVKAVNELLQKHVDECEHGGCGCVAPAISSKNSRWSTEDTRCKIYSEYAASGRSMPTACPIGSRMNELVARKASNK